MRKSKINRPTLILLICGICINTTAFVLSQSGRISDVVYGVMVGSGLGMLILALFTGKKQQYRRGKSHR